MPVSRRQFLGTAVAAGTGTALRSVAVTGSPDAAPMPDGDLPIHEPERRVSAGSGALDPFAGADDELLNHAMPPDWRARFVLGLGGRTGS